MKASITLLISIQMATSVLAAQANVGCKPESQAHIQQEMETESRDLGALQQESAGTPADRLKVYRLTASVLRKYGVYEACEAEGAASMLLQLDSLRNRSATGGAARAAAEANAFEVQTLLVQVRGKIAEQLETRDKELGNTVNTYEEIGAVSAALTDKLRSEELSRRQREGKVAEIDNYSNSLGFLEWAFHKRASLAGTLALVYESRADRMERSTDRAKTLDEVESVLAIARHQVQQPGPETMISDWATLQQSFQPSDDASDVKQIRKAAKQLIKKGVLK